MTPLPLNPQQQAVAAWVRDGAGSLNLVAIAKATT